MNKWPFITISELIESKEADLQTGPFGTQLKASEYVAEGIPVINVRNIGYGKIRQDKLEFIDDKKADNLKVHKLLNGDIVFGRKGAVDRHTFIDEHSSGWIQGSDCLRLRIKSKRICNKFMSYYFSTSSHKYWMEAVCSFGATMSSLNQEIVKRISFSLPHIAEQNKIAAILSAYDDLIENNNCRIALLEKMAEEIYREWFVRMRFPGYEKVKFSKGIPKGWKRKPFSDAVKINPKENIDSFIDKPFVGMENLSTTSMCFTYKEKRSGKSGSKFRNGDVLFPRITPCLENGKRGFVMGLGENEVGLGSTEFIVMRSKELSSEHIYLITCSDQFRKHAEISMAGASGRQRVQENCFSFFLVAIPPDKLKIRFKNIIKPYFKNIFLLYQKNEVLKKTRDMLLGRLISGKLSVENLSIQFPPSMQDEQEKADA